MPIYFYEGELLFENGAIAMHEDCCCDGNPCDPYPGLEVTISWTDVDVTKSFFGETWTNGETKILCPDSYSTRDCLTSIITTNFISYLAATEAWAISQTGSILLYAATGGFEIETSGGCYPTIFGYNGQVVLPSSRSINSNVQMVGALCGCDGNPFKSGSFTFGSNVLLYSGSLFKSNSTLGNKGTTNGIGGSVTFTDGVSVSWTGMIR